MKFYKLKDALAELLKSGGTLWYDAAEKYYYILKA